MVKINPGIKKPTPINMDIVPSKGPTTKLIFPELMSETKAHIPRLTNGTKELEILYLNPASFHFTFTFV